MTIGLNKDIRKMARLATAIFLFAFMAGCPIEMEAASKTTKNNTQVSKNTFENPDFAFPRDVMRNADKEYASAVNNKEWAKALQAAMQMCVSEQAVSSEAADSCVMIFDNVAKAMPQPYSALARLMQASVLRQAYQSDSWTYEQRNLPADQLPESISLWDKRMFADSVLNLVKEAQAGLGFGTESIVNYPRIIQVNGKASLSEPFTLSDFIYWKSLECLSPFADAPDGNLIPFKVQGQTLNSKGTTSSTWTFKEELRNKWLKTLKKETPAQIVYFVLEHCSEYDRTTSQSNNMGFWKEWADYYKDSESVEAVLTLWATNWYSVSNSNSLESDAVTENEFGGMIREAINRFPKGLYTPNLKNALNGLTRPRVEVSIQREYLPEKDVEVKVTDSNQPEFWLQVLKMPDSYRDKDFTVGTAVAKGSKVATIPVKIDEVAPFEKEMKVTLGQFPIGLYTVIPTSSSSLSAYNKNTERQDAQYFVVSEFSLISQRTVDSDMGVYVVDGAEGGPLQGVNVEVYQWLPYNQRKQSNDKRLALKEVSNENGEVSIPNTINRIEEIKLSKGKDLLTVDQTINPMKSVESQRTQAALLLDRSIAKPGQEVNYELIACTQQGNDFQALADGEFEIKISNASYVLVDTLKVKTDSHGNVHGTYRLPEKGMLGNWIFDVQRKIGKGRYEPVWSTRLRVEEYKTPTFQVSAQAELPEAGTNSDEIKIKGYARTYSGMAVGNAEVNLNIQYRPWNPWRWGYMPATFATKTRTAADGSFEVILNTEDFKDTRFANAPFTFEVSVTSEAGETQTTDGDFVVGKGYIISPSIPNKIEVKGETLKLDVKVNDMLGYPVKKQVKYEVFNADSDGNNTAATPLVSGVFESPTLELPGTQLPSGSYHFKFSMPDEEDVAKATSNAILWREDDFVPPVETTLWVPVTSLIAPANAKEITVRYGSSYPGQKVLCIISDTKKVISKEWLTPSGKMAELRVPVPEDGERIFVSLNAIHNLKGSSEQIVIKPASANTQMKIETITFRDHLSAGQKEKWEFRFVKGGEGISGVSGVAVMTDKALNSLVPFEWRFNPRSVISFSSATNLRNYWAGSRSLYFNFGKYNYLKEFHFNYPEWKYNFEYGNDGVYYAVVTDEVAMMDSAGPIHIRGTSMQRKSAANTSFAMAAPMMESAKEESEEEMANSYDAEDIAMGGSSEGGNSGVGETPDVELRQSECPVAFFMPNISGGKDGKLSVEFETPNFNTTWQFQLLGYTSDMQTATLKIDAISAKPVMVSMNAPRFVRTSDRIILAATAFNNTENELPLGGRIEVVDALTGKVLAAKDFKETKTAPSGSRLLEMEYTVPTDVQMLALRAYALSKGNSDGEQTPVMVLPSSSPVIESLPIYIGVGQEEYTLKMPKFGSDSSVTLTYCDNPLWYCLTALPDLTEDTGVSSLNVMRALYGNAIGLGLISNNPSLKTGLEEMLKADADGKTTILDSPLESNASLKIAELGNTPWVNNAQAETLRMHSLGNLLDSEEGQKVIDGLTEKLLTYKRYNGGFAWCPEGDASEWATGQILLYNAMLGRFGYLPENASYRQALTNALGYAETEMLKAIKQSKNSDAAIEGMRNLLYVRSYYATAGLLPNETLEFHKLADKCIGLVKANWRSYSIYEKATAATLLQREGEKQAAAEILASLAQFATTSESKGMWFDTLEGGTFSPWNKLITTAQVLEAYMDIDPKSPDVDKLRQWLLLQRQAEDWNGMGYSAELVQGVLSSGSDWAGDNSAPEITVDGKPIVDLSSFPKYGEAVINLDPKKVSGKELVIRRNGKSPAWGGVISQFIAPISEIKSTATEDVKVTKEIYLLREQDGQMVPMSINAKTNVKKGDLVRVLLTVENNRDMEYVVLKDERAACFEPVEALSGRSVIDGIWLYKEVRNTETNLFVPFLRSGKFQVSYDCRISQEGEFAAGIATLQSQYAPTLTAHSAGKQLEVK